MRRFRQSAIFLLAVCGVLSAASKAQNWSAVQALNYPAAQGQLNYFTSDYGSALAQAPDGYLYGAVHVTNGGSYTPNTTFFRLEPGGFVYSYLGSLPSEVFIDPPTLADDGNIYDFDDDYSLNNSGTATLQQPAWKSLVQNAGINYGISGKEIVTVTLPSTATPLYTFTDNETPTWITIGNDGNIYGVSETGGASGDGTIFKVTPAGVETTLYNFSGTGGPSSIMQATDGNFYGIAGTGAGTIFQFLPASSALVYLHTFSNQPPLGGLIEASDGNLYGATKYTNVAGYIFKQTLAGKFTELSVGYANDDYPNSSLVQGSDGNLYLGASSPQSYAGVLELEAGPALAAPVQISASATTVSVGTPITLTWSTANMPAGTYQPCFASGGWSGAKAISGTATVTPEQAGGATYSITCNGNESNSVTVEVTSESQAATTTLLTGSVHNIAVDLPLTLTATVSPSSATGKVYVYMGSTRIGSATLVGGVATVSVNTYQLYYNTYQFSATYTGDSNYAPSQSAPLTILDQVTTAVTASAAPNPLGQGQAVNLYATVTDTQGQNQGAPVPAGAVTFASGSYVIGSATSTTGSWQLIVPAANVPVGTYSVVASYSGDSAHLAAASSPFSVTVKYVPQIKLTVTPNPVPKGAEVTITVQVTGAAKGDPAPTGNVVILGTYNLNLNSSGTASITVPTSGYPAGTYPVNATYAGDLHYLGGTSNTVEVTLK